MDQRKISVVIADDEERICRLITALGEWEALGMEVIGTAENGPAALKLLSEKTVDILITDIRMPGLNGIDLIEQAKSVSPATKYIIISGYAEFAYAQQAVHMGVEDYLLKPINQGQLNEALQKISGKLLGEEAREKELKHREELFRTRVSEVRSDLIKDLLMDPAKRLTFQDLAEKYDFHSQGEYYCFICIKLDITRNADLSQKRENGKGEEFSAGEAFFWEKVSFLLSEQLKEAASDFVLFIQKHYLYGCLNYESSREETIKKALRNALNQLGSLKGIFRSGTLSMALGSAVQYPEDLGRALVSAQRAIGERLLKGEGKLLTLKTERTVLYEKRLLDSFSKSIGTAFDNYDGEALLAAVTVMQREALTTEGVCGFELTELVRQAGDMLVMRLELPDGRERLSAFYEECDNCSQADLLFEALRGFASGLLNIVLEAREDDTLRAIRQAKKYLANHYTEQITLEEVSERSGLTASYFSTLFKKETGTGFAKYLMGLRIEAAKELLRESNLSVAEICRSVGYNDVKHFTKNFEQYAGIKPAVYRKLYG